MKLSICCITYNQEKYIAQTLEGMLFQQTDFDVEIIIGEDHSTDNTKKIIEEYQQKYPGKIRLMPHVANIGVRKNFAQTLLAATGEYVAICEGDDYWTDPLKLQKQVDYLDAHPEADLCFHNTAIVHEDTGATTLSNKSGQAPLTNIYDLINDWYIMTCSMVYRRNFTTLPDWFTTVFNTDYALQMIITGGGAGIGYLEDTMAVYRKHDAGESAKVWGDDPYYWLMYMFDKLNKEFKGKYAAAITKRKKKISATLADYYKKTIARQKGNPALKAKLMIRFLFMKINKPGFYYKKFLTRKQLTV
jgi:glycosyltransferase involved in cell wall biosynthesis